MSPPSLYAGTLCCYLEGGGDIILKIKFFKMLSYLKIQKVSFVTSYKYVFKGRERGEAGKETPKKRDGFRRIL